MWLRWHVLIDTSGGSFHAPFHLSGVAVSPPAFFSIEFRRFFLVVSHPINHTGRRGVCYFGCIPV